MYQKTKEFLKFAMVPLIFLATFLVFVSVYQFFGLPSSEEIVSLAKQYYAEYGYWVVFLGALAEGILLINWYLPGSVIVVLGGVFAGHDIPRVILTITLIMLGFFLTSLLNYAMGRFGWYHLLLKLGLKKPLEHAHKRVEQYGLPLIFSTYFHPNIGALTATSAGILKLSFKRFVLYSLIATILWNTLWGIVVYVSGPPILKLLSVWSVVGVLFLWIIFLGIKFYKKDPLK